MAMAQLALGDNDARERELSVHSLGLVDTAFEEGQDDSAMALLSRLRHPSYKPYPPHVRYVLCLALHPPPSTEGPLPRAATLDTIPSSPSKYAAKQRASFTPSIAVIEAARSFLYVLAQTNSTQSICRALPNFGLTGIDGLPEIEVTADTGTEIIDFELKRLSKRIQDAKSCWEILKEGFIRREAVEPVPQRKRGKRSDKRGTDDQRLSPDTCSDPPAPVGEHAWPVLEFLISVFEKEELAMSTKHDLRFSPHLLAQIPASRTAAGARWDVAAPLDVVFYCVKDPQRSGLGVRLLVLLINLTSTIHLDFAMMLNAASNRLLSASADEIQSIFAQLPPSPVCLRFQLVLCKLCLTEPQGADASKGKPRPQARTKPQPLVRTKEPSLVDATASSSTSTLARKFPSVSTAEVLSILGTAPTSTPSDPTSLQRKLFLKFYMVSAFGGLQEQLLPTERDKDWTHSVRNGGLAGIVDSAFAVAAPADAAAVAKDLHMMLTLTSAQ